MAYYKYYDEYIRSYGDVINAEYYNHSRMIYLNFDDETKKRLVGAWIKDDNSGDRVAGPNFSVCLEEVLKNLNIDLYDDIHIEWAYEAGIRDSLIENNLYKLLYEIK